ncbi:hypothetical protein HRbin25_00852 [bacterium HR25]|nr:hypothetical protein HRbin25_00852 [bacterium HR25]
MEEGQRYSLCPACDACPEVVVYSDHVLLGEPGNQTRLTREEWNRLVAAIRSGELGEL